MAIGVRGAAALLWAAFAVCGPAAAETSRTGAAVKIDGARGSVFAAGASVEINGAVTSGLTPATGVFAAGGSVVVTASIDGSLAAVGGDVAFSGNADSLFVSGGNVKIAGRVENGAMLAGGHLSAGPAAVFKRDLHAAGATVDIAGSIAGDLKLAGAFVRFNGSVAGDAELAGDDIVIGPDARIAGDLTYYAEGQATIDPLAQIDGAVIRKDPGERRVRWEREGRGPFAGGDFRSRAYGALFWFVALAGSGALMALLFPRWLGAAAAAGRDRPLTSLLIGFATLVALPVAAILFMLIVLGLPLGGFLIALYLGLLSVSMIGAGLAVGHLLLDREDGRRVNFLAYFAGLAVLLIAGAAPLVGGILSFLAMLLGIGVLMRGLWSAMRSEA